VCVHTVPRHSLPPKEGYSVPRHGVPGGYTSQGGNVFRRQLNFTPNTLGYELG